MIPEIRNPEMTKNVNADVSAGRFLEGVKEDDRNHRHRAKPVDFRPIRRRGGRRLQACDYSMQA